MKKNKDDIKQNKRSLYGASNFPENQFFQPKSFDDLIETNIKHDYGSSKKDLEKSNDGQVNSQANFVSKKFSKSCKNKEKGCETIDID